MPDQNPPETLDKNEKVNTAKKSKTSKRPISEARLAANRANAKRSTGSAY